MIRVLFVCLGNFCRSPMGEAIFRHKVKEEGLEGLIEADSAGTAGWLAGSRPHKGTLDVLRKHHIDDTGITSRQVRPTDFHDFDYIVAMDRSNVKDLHEAAGQGAHKAEVLLMLDLVPGSPIRDVPDPWYTGNFDETYRLLNAGCEWLLALIRMREGI